MKAIYDQYLRDHIALFSELDSLSDVVMAAGELLIDTIDQGSKILTCGNGGSAADAQHLAAELVVRFERNRVALPAISLSTDTSILTAMGNDFGFDMIFERQVEALGTEGDLLVAISTSGRSNNVLRAVKMAASQRIRTVGLLGRDGGEIAPLVDDAVVIPYDNTARIQEAHIFIIHFWCSIIEKHLEAQ
jgi:D-sedoheptulose 7-phosphate isomerase